MSRQPPSDGTPPPSGDTEVAALLREIERLRSQVDELLAEETAMNDDIESRVNEVEERLRELEAKQRREVIKHAARFGADVHVARGLAPLGWDGEARASFEEDLRKHLEAKLAISDQDEANALAIQWMEVAQS